MPTPLPSISLALSGGGFRAAAFHAGVCRYLAEQNSLERVGRISSVSGGTLFAGLVFHLSGYAWPSSEQYLSRVLPGLKKELCTKSLQGDAILRLLRPRNWRFISARAHVLAQSIAELWGITATLDALPEQPAWHINGTTSETGKRFQCKGTLLGDYSFGYTRAPAFPLASAMAVSAAFPVGVGPLPIVCTDWCWHKRATWGPSDKTVIEPEHPVINVYDGGVYDNLGLEPFFDVGRQRPKGEQEGAAGTLFVSDAGAPYSRTAIPRWYSPNRVARLMDIMLDQIRALRSRCFVNYLKGGQDRGLYLQLGCDPRATAEKRLSGEEREAALREIRLDAAAVCRAQSYPTTLARMREEDFDLLVRHGRETTCINHLAFLRGDTGETPSA